MINMIDVSNKMPTARLALATGKIQVGNEAFALIRDKKLPKGDALMVAEIAGIQAAKNVSQLLPLCHPLSLDHVRLRFELDEATAEIRAYCVVKTVAKTGVEMEALAGVQAALLTIYDLTKMINPQLIISDTQLLLKTGGKKGVWQAPSGIPKWAEAFLPTVKKELQDIKAALVTLSDRAKAGVYNDESGRVLKASLEAAGAVIVDQVLFPDDFATLENYLVNACDNRLAPLIVLTGGTGIAPRDITPEVLAKICTRMVPGMGELLRHHSAQFTQWSWVSRCCAGVRHKSLILALPGNPNAITESLPAVIPLLPHMLAAICGGEHNVKV